MSRPLVSIITPTYNHEMYIAECLQTVVDQSFYDWEQIVINDGSTDMTRDIAEKFADTDSRIHVINQANRGIWNLRDSYNAALERSKGEYVAILEGDDFWPLHKLERQVQFHLSHPDVVMSYGMVKMVESCDGGIERVFSDYGQPERKGIFSRRDFQTMLFMKKSFIMPVSVMIRRDQLTSIGGFAQEPYFPAVDFSTFVRLSMTKGPFAYLDELLGYWRQSSTQVTQSLSVELAEGTLQICLQAMESIGQEYLQELGVTRSDIVKAHKVLISDACLEKVRYGLLTRDAELVHSFARKLWNAGGVKRKLQAIYAQMGIRLGFDMELPLRMLSRWMSSH